MTNTITVEPSDIIARLRKENADLKKVLSQAIPWIGENREGPAWATPEAKLKNCAMCDKVLDEAISFFPEILQ